MPEPAKSSAELDAEAGEGAAEEEANPPSGDVDALLARAKEARAKKDLAGALAAYRAAAELESDEAEFAIALFHATGVPGVVARDYAELARRLRVAANRGHVPSKIYLANLYELGVQYAKDEEKADVWYRNAARSAKLAAEPDSDEYVVAMAKLGAVRYCLALAEEPSTSAEDKELYLRKAKAFGYQLHLRRESMTPTPPPSEVPASIANAPEVAPSEDAAKSAEPATKTPTKGASKAEAKPAKAKEEDPEARAQAFARAKYRKIALLAFVYALFFTALGVGVGYLCFSGARELLAHGRPSAPIVGTHPERAMWILYPLLGVLPALMVYRAKTWLYAVLSGGIAAFVGYVLSASPSTAFVALRWVQTLLCFGGAFLIALFVLGLLGGAKLPNDRRR